MTTAQRWKCARCGARELDTGAPLPDGWFLKIGVGAAVNDRVLCAACREADKREAERRARPPLERKVLVRHEETRLANEKGRDVPAIEMTCMRCNHTTDSYGTSDRSVRRCFAKMREECPEGERNFYTDDPEEADEDELPLLKPIEQATMPPCPLSTNETPPAGAAAGASESSATAEPLSGSTITPKLPTCGT